MMFLNEKDLNTEWNMQIKKKQINPKFSNKKGYKQAIQRWDP